MSSQFVTIPCSRGCVICSMDRYWLASSPTMMSPRSAGRALAPRSSARRMGRPTMDGNVNSGKSVRMHCQHCSVGLSRSPVQLLVATYFARHDRTLRTQFPGPGRWESVRPCCEVATARTSTNPMLAVAPIRAPGYPVVTCDSCKN